MTDLTGAELDLAVARVMGRPCILGALVAGDPATVTCFSTPANGAALVMLSRYEWRPSKGGAAAWEVLEWVMARYDEIWMAWVDLNDQGAGRACGITINHDRQVRGSGPTDAIALCRAVVALGEAG